MSDGPDPIAMAEQRAMELKGLAEMQTTYFRTLILGGMERAEAMELIHAHAETVFWPEGQDEDDD